MASVMFQFPWAGGPPSLAEVADQFGLRRGEVDAHYGVVLVDPAASLYVVLLDDSAADRVRSGLTAEQVAAGAGIFANPDIEPTTPPEP